MYGPRSSGRRRFRTQEYAAVKKEVLEWSPAAVADKVGGRTVYIVATTPHPDGQTTSSLALASKTESSLRMISIMRHACALSALREPWLSEVITPRATSNSWSKSRALRASFRPHLRTVRSAHGSLCFLSYGDASLVLSLVETSGAVNYAAMTGLLQPFQCANISFSFTYLCRFCPIRARRSELSW
jgi:hypothetical protein